MRQSSAIRRSVQEKSRSSDIKRCRTVVKRWRYTDHRDPKETRCAQRKSKMEEVFGNAEIVAKDKGYYIIHSVKE